MGLLLDSALLHVPMGLFLCIVYITVALQYVLILSIANPPLLFFHLKNFLAILVHLHLRMNSRRNLPSVQK